MITQELLNAVMDTFDDSKTKAKRVAGEPLLSPDEKAFFVALTKNAAFGSAAAEGAQRVIEGAVLDNSLRSFAACAALAYIGYAIAKAEAVADAQPKEAVNA